MADKRIIKYKKYISLEGDTWDTLALAMYRDEKMACTIMDFNPDYAEYIILPAGLSLRLPILEDTYDGGTSLPPWRRAEDSTGLEASEGVLIQWST